jgi:hypothetical protein
VKETTTTFLVLLAVLVAAGCGETTQDADAVIKLVADPALNSEREVADRLATIEMLFDAQGGFRGINENKPQAEGFLSVDPDEDGEAELLLKMSVRGNRTLPTVGLDAGSNRSTQIAVRARGLDEAGVVAAVGGTDPQLLFPSSGRNEVEVPFNLSRTHLPPRIVAVAPMTVPSGGGLASIAFYASGPLDASFLAENVSVWLVSSGGGGDQAVDGTITGPIHCPFGTHMYNFVPSGCQQSPHRLSGIKLIVAAGPTVTVPVDQVKEFGSCAPRMRCEEIGINAPGDTDIACNLQTGLFEPAPCSLSVLGCRPEAVFDWVRAAGTPECQAFRPDSLHQDGACVVSNPWPCIGPEACAGVGTGICDNGIGLCIPDSCTDSCTPDTLACVPGEGCLPRMGGCAQDCSTYGACPEFDQECVLGEGGGHVCR